MPGIRQQRDRVREHAIDDLDHHQRNIEQRRDREHAAEICRRVDVRMSRMRVAGVGMLGIKLRHAMPPIGSDGISMSRFDSEY